MRQRARLGRRAVDFKNRLRGRGFLRRRLGAGQAEERVVGPAIRHDHAGQGGDQQHRQAPKADHVVPVEIPRLAGQLGIEREPGLEAAPAQRARPPQVDT